MDKINFRIQRQNNLNDVYVSNDEQDMFNGVHHKYQVKTLYCDDPHLPEYAKESKVLAEINFQKGPRKDPASVHGVLESDLLEILRDRYQGHQASAYASRENAIILTHIEEALMWSAKRADDRAERGVLGTTEK